MVARTQHPHSSLKHPSNSQLPQTSNITFIQLDMETSEAGLLRRRQQQVSGTEGWGIKVEAKLQTRVSHLLK